MRELQAEIDVISDFFVKIRLPLSGDKEAAKPVYPFESDTDTLRGLGMCLRQVCQIENCPALTFVTRTEDRDAHYGASCMKPDCPTL